MSIWQPIETAPKDRRILAFGKIGFESGVGIATVIWNRTYGVWNCDPNEATEYDFEECKVTHWMPLPEPPASMTFAPWSDSQIAALKKWQTLGFVHEFTCPHGHGALDAQRDFWMCVQCGYTQNWAHDFMCDEAKHPTNPLDALARLPQR